MTTSQFHLRPFEKAGPKNDSRKNGEAKTFSWWANTGQSNIRQRSDFIPLVPLEFMLVLIS